MPLQSDIVLVEGYNELNIQMTPIVAPPGKATIYGFVTDALTGLPIPQVQVTLDGLVRYTGTEGQYEISDIAVGTYHLNFYKEGYQSITRDIVLIEGLNEVSVQMALILPTKPQLVYAYPVEAQVASGGTGHIKYKVGIPDITIGYILMFLFPLGGVYCWTPYGCANVDFRAGAKAGFYEGSAAWYVQYLYAAPYKFANIPPGKYRLLSTCQLYQDGTLVKTYWSNVDTGQIITVV